MELPRYGEDWEKPDRRRYKRDSRRHHFNEGVTHHGDETLLSFAKSRRLDALATNRR
jgi:hypothetical protein